MVEQHAAVDRHFFEEDREPFAVLARMPPAGVALSALLHATLAAALIAELPVRPHALAAPQAVEFTVELSAPSPDPAAREETAPPLSALPDPPPLPTPQDFALLPTEPATAEPTTAMAEANTRAERTVAEPSPAEPQPPPQPAPQPTEPRPAPDLAEQLPRAEPPPPPAARDFVAAASSAAAPASPQVKPQARPAEPPRAAVAARAPTAAPPTASPSAAIGATEAAREQSRRSAREDYLWQVVRKLSQARFTTEANQARAQGMVVTRLTVARDGRLLALALARSSGSSALDARMLETIRRAAPFAPLPADIADDAYTFLLPINYAREY